MRNIEGNHPTRAILPFWQAALGAIVLAIAMLSPCLHAQFTTTTVQGIVYRADGSPAAGTLLISWPAFTTAQNQAVAAGSMTAVIGPDGLVSLNLTPNAGATPAGSYYTAVYHLGDGTVNTEYWVVPAAGTASVASVRAQLEPATVAVQSVSQNYVDSAITTLAGASLPLSGGVMDGPLTLNADPTAAQQAATKHYADQLAAADLPLSGGSLTGTVNGTGANFSGTLTASNAVLASGPYIDVRSFGAKCDGSTDDASAIQAALNQWALNGGTLISPTGATCVFRSNLSAVFTRSNSWSVPHKIDLRGGEWLSQVPSGTALAFSVSGVSIDVENIELTNGILWDSGNASLAVDFNGGGSATHFMSDVVLNHFHIHATGAGTSGVHFKSVYQSRCFSSTVDGYVGSGIYGYWFEQQASGDQATGDFSWYGCDSTGFDHGLYSNGVNEVKLFSGTFLQSWEEAVYIDSGVASEMVDVHAENGWYQNPSAAVQRAEVYCANCYLNGVVGAVSDGNANGAVRLFSSNSVAEAGIRGGWLWQSGTSYPYAFVGTAAGSYVNVEGWAPSSVSVYTGSSCNILFQSGGSFNLCSLQINGNTPFVTNQAAAPQWISIGTSGGYMAFWHQVGQTSVPEIYYAINYGGGTYGVMGLWENPSSMAVEVCSNLTGVTPPNLGTPTGCSAKYQFNGGNYPLILSGANIYNGSKFSFAPDGGIIPAIPAGTNGLPSTATSGIPYFTNANALLGGQYTPSNPLPLTLLPATTLSGCGTLTTTAAASDSLACSWVTSSSTCAFSPANSAASSLSGLYITPGSGSVSLFHSATAGAAFAVSCSTH